MSSTVTDSGRFTVFEIAPEMNGCAAAIIFTWPIARDRALADGHVEHRQVLVAAGRARPRSWPCSARCASISLDLLGRVAERLERQRHGAG